MDEVSEGDPCYWSLWFLVKSYTYPRKISGESLKLWTIKAITVKLMTFILIIAILCHMYQLIAAEIEADLSEDISATVGMFGVLLTNMFFITSVKRWSEFMRKALDFGPSGRPSSLDTVSERLGLIAKLASAYTLFGGILYACVNYFDSASCEELRAKGFNFICRLMAPLWMPFEVNAVGKWTLFMANFFVALNAAFSAFMICIFVYGVTQVLICHIGRLREVIEGGFGEGETYMASKERLRYFVQYHNYILGMCQEQRKLVKRTLGHLPPIAALVFAAIANQVFKTKPVSAMLFLCGWVVSLYIICHMGQKIMDEVASINETIVSTSWYNLHPKLQKDLNFIIMRTQKDFMYEAIPLGTMNYSVFMAILQTSYSYFTLLSKST